MDSSDVTVLGLLGLVIGGVMTALQRLIDYVLNKRNGSNGNTSKIDKLLSMHEHYDSDGIPLWYVPRKWGTLLEQLVDQGRTNAETHRLAVGILDRIEKRKCPMADTEK